MKQSESIAKLAAALVAVHRALRPIAKDATNPHFKSKFASLDAIMVEIRPILAENGLAVLQGATTPHTNEAGIVTAFTVESQLIHASGEWILSSVVMPIVKSDPQGAGAAITYGRRYGVSALLGLSTDEDDDGNAASQRSGAKGGRAGRERGTAESGTLPTHTTTATAQPTFTRDSKWPALPHLDVPVRELPDEFVSWAVAPGRRLGKDTDAWQKVLREELVHRATNGVPAGSR